jgi:hypothetical protein
LTFRLYEKRDIQLSYEKGDIEVVDERGTSRLATSRLGYPSRRRGAAALDRHRQTDNASSIYLHELWFVAS